ncbi:MAG: peptidoglycan DD-metalloendopeptidase family protein [Armatimonadota bacterium]|nr:peptidoglycan DD-metalloendopeptidase family protein [Armatimonadota bacterium]
MREKLIIALAILVACFAVAQKPSKTELKRKQGKVQSRANNLRKEIRETKRDITYVVSDIHKADSLLADAKSTLRGTESRLGEAKASQTRVAEELVHATEKLDTTRDQISSRMRVLYMQGEQTPIASYLDAESFSREEEQTFVLQKLADQDDQLVSDLRAYRQIVSRKKKEKDALVSRISELIEKQVLARAVLEQRKAFKRDVLGQLHAEKAQSQAQLDALERESASIEGELRRYYGTRRASSVAKYSGRFRIPVSGRMSSGFGGRYHPVLKRTRMHTGVDIAAPTGTAIHAAGDGEVIFAGWRGGYGNCIIIDHGGGTATLYGHCSRLYVGVGKKVSTGDSIAAVGSTGMSTGPHLHWEVRVNGTPVNPLGR